VSTKIFIKQLYPTDIFRVFCPITAEYAFFLCLERTFTKIHDTLSQKAHNNKFTRIEITQSMFSNWKEIKLEINNRKTIGKIHFGKLEKEEKLKLKTNIKKKK
jgi:hypothetical protein